MAFAHGKAAQFTLDNSAGSPTDISAYLDSISFPEQVGLGETTAFGSTSKSFIVGLKDSSISVSGKFDTTQDAQIAATVGLAASLSFVYGPTGTTVGMTKYTGECFITQYSVSSPVGDVVSFQLDMQVTGNVTRTTY